MGIRFVSLEPTRIAMVSPDITISGPISIAPIPGIPSIPPGDGLAAGVGMCI
jgi:hypothetical protein